MRDRLHGGQPPSRPSRRTADARLRGAHTVRGRRRGLQSGSHRKRPRPVPGRQNNHAQGQGRTHRGPDRGSSTEVQTEVQAIHDADPHMREGAPMPGLLDELSSLATASGASPAAARRQRAGAVGVREDGEVVQAGARDGVQAAAAFGLPRGCRSPRRESAMRVLLPGPHTFRSGGAPVGDHAPVGEVGLELEHLLSGAALRAVG